jgi:hypothetical protein
MLCLRGGHGIKVWLCLSISWLFVASSLYFLPLHAHAKLRTSSQKQLMIVRSSIRSLGNAAKAVEVELSLERC